MWNDHFGNAEPRLHMSLRSLPVSQLMDIGEPAIREFKKLLLLLQRKRHIKIELCVTFSVLRLFYVGHVVQNRPSALWLAWHEWFSPNGRKLNSHIPCSNASLVSHLLHHPTVNFPPARPTYCFSRTSAKNLCMNISIHTSLFFLRDQSLFESEGVGEKMGSLDFF